MDLTDPFELDERHRAAVAAAMLSNPMRLSVVCAARSHLALLALAQGICRPAVVTGLVTTQAEALERVQRQPAGLLICTDQLEQGSGVALVAEARRAVADLRVLMILSERLPDPRGALRAGSHAILVESELGETSSPLCLALEAAAAGLTYTSPRVERLLAELQADATEDGMAQLTRREEEVLTLIISGCTDREIAAHLSLSPQTVRGYAKDIRRKFGARSRVELLGRALRKALGRRERLR